MGALPNAQTWQQYKFGIGPWIDGLFSQSNFGVVTKMGFWLMPEPDAYLIGHRHRCRSTKTSMPLVDILNYLENSGIVNGMPQLGSPLLGGFFAPLGTELRDLFARGASTEELEDYARRQGTGYWSCTLKFYGPAKAIAANWEYAQEKFAAIPGATFENGETFRFPLSSAEIEDITTQPGRRFARLDAAGVRRPEPDDVLDRRASRRSIRTRRTATCGSRRSSRAAARQSSRPTVCLRRPRRELDLPINAVGFSLPTTYWNRGFIYLFGFPVSRDIATNQRNRAKFEQLVQVAAEHGWGEYRTPPAYQEAVMSTYSFNNHALRRFHETLKDAVDPNGILAAGRYGIWPKHLRKG